MSEGVSVSGGGRWKTEVWHLFMRAGQPVNQTVSHTHTSITWPRGHMDRADVVLKEPPRQTVAGWAWGCLSAKVRGWRGFHIHLMGQLPTCLVLENWSVVIGGWFYHIKIFFFTDMWNKCVLSLWLLPFVMYSTFQCLVIWTNVNSPI